MMDTDMTYGGIKENAPVAENGEGTASAGVPNSAPALNSENEAEGGPVSNSVNSVTDAYAPSPTESDGENAPTESDEGSDAYPDYERMIEEDLRELKAGFPELSALDDIAQLPNAMRYAALRDLGLTATEAYLATSSPRTRQDNRSHLVTAVSRSAGAPRGSMSRSELAVARELFSDMTDAQLYELYKRVNK